MTDSFNETIERLMSGQNRLEKLEQLQRRLRRKQLFATVGIGAIALFMLFYLYGIWIFKLMPDPLQ